MSVVSPSPLHDLPMHSRLSDPAPVTFFLDQMFGAGLSPTLVEALTKVSTYIPNMLPPVQERLLTAISIILATNNTPAKDVSGSTCVEMNSSACIVRVCCMC